MDMEDYYFDDDESIEDHAQNAEGWESPPSPRSGKTSFHCSLKPFGIHL